MTLRMYLAMYIGWTDQYTATMMLPQSTSAAGVILGNASTRVAATTTLIQNIRWPVRYTYRKNGTKRTSKAWMRKPRVMISAMVDPFVRRKSASVFVACGGLRWNALLTTV